MAEYSLAKDIKSQTKVGFGIYVFDFMFLVIYAIIAYVLRFLVNDNLMIFYALFSAAMAIFLTMPSRMNRLRRNYESLFIYLNKDNAVYRPVKNISKEKFTR